jgi:pilus assembly protein CpaB
MRLGRLLIVLAIVVILGVVALYAFFNLTAPNVGEGEGAQGSTDIVIVVQPIPRGGIITAEALGYLAFPTEDTIANMFTSIDQVVGGRARYDLEPGLPLTTNMVVSSASDLSETGSDTALLIPAGMVAFPVTIDRFSSLAYGLRAGDHVNVIATMQLVDLDANFQTLLPNNTGAVIAPGSSVLITTEGEEQASSELVLDPLLNVLTSQIASGGSTAPQGQAEVDPVLNQPFYVVPSEDNQRPRLVSQTLLQDIVVLHVGNFLYTDESGNVVENAYEPESPGVDSSGQALPPGPKPPPDIITLIVSPQDAVTLNYLLYAGAKLSMALRSSGDDSITNIEAVTLEYLLDTYNIPAPSKLPYGLETRIDTLESPTMQLDFPVEEPLP